MFSLLFPGKAKELKQLQVWYGILHPYDTAALALV